MKLPVNSNPVIVNTQKRLLEIAKIVTQILENHKIPYMLALGTLLGAVRHKGFIPWDDDFDIIIFDEHYDQAMIFLRNELSSDLFLEDQYSEPLYFHSWAHVKDLNSIVEFEEFPQDAYYSHKGISFDLYRSKKMPFHELQQYLINENLRYINCRHEKGLISEEEYNKRLLSINKDINIPNPHKDDSSIVYSLIGIYKTKHMYEDDIFPLKKYTFEDVQFLGPNNADAILKSVYGDYMKLPPTEKRRSHYSKVIFK